MARQDLGFPLSMRQAHRYQPMVPSSSSILSPAVRSLPREASLSGVTPSSGGLSISRQGSLAAGGDDVVQFFSTTFYVKETEKARAVVRVVRIGTLQGPCSVEWRTEDSSAQKGKKYKEAKGTIDFGPGESVRSVEVEILDDDSFDSTLDFLVLLENASNCVIDPEGRQCVVMIMDDDIFPSNAFEEELEQQSEDLLYEVGWSLLRAFMWFCYEHVPEIAKKSVAMLLMSMLGNAYYLGTIFIRVYLVDTVLNNTDPSTESRLWFPGDRDSTAVALGLAWILPNFILLGSDWFEMKKLEMGFNIRYHLRVNLFRKYLNYTDKSVSAVPLQDLKISMMEDIPELVSQGYLIIFELWAMMGKIICIAYFMLRKHPFSAIPLFVYPLLIMLYLHFTYTQRLQLMAKEGEGQSATTGTVMQLHKAQGLIQAYGASGYVVHHFEKILRNQRSLTMQLKTFEFWNSQLIPWITLLAIGIYMSLASRVVLHGHTSLGSFLATINVYKDLGDRFSTVLRGFTSLSKSISPLCGLTLQFSLEVDVPARADCFKRREAFALSWIQVQRGRKISMDDIPIVFQDVCVDYSPCMNSATGGLTAHAPQGSIIQIAGPHDSGKGIVLSLLCDALPPSSGSVLVSPHLHLLNVPHVPLFMGSVGVFGNIHVISDAGEYSPAMYARGLRMLQRLRLDKPWIKEMYDSEARALREAAERMGHGSPESKFWCYEEDDDGNNEDEEEEEEEYNPWINRLSTSEKWRLQLARAFLHNPHVLALTRPVQELDEDLRQVILSCFQEFVTARGLDMDHLDVAHRRPRTVIFTTGATDQYDIADYVWRVSPSSGVTVEKRPPRRV
mmetsp:Transcript_8545/g.20284  ORF Transcript_8545/g.20284 Transcript_8545/m.20284 type:complete len:841 (-) Transcript_8545:23-2545(-)